MHFAEFLNHCSPNRLGILYLSTCVGLGYGQHVSTRRWAFLGSIGSVTSPESARYHVSGYMRSGFAWPSPYTLTPGQPSPGITYLPASPYGFPPRGGSDSSGLEGRDSPLATRNWNGRAHGRYRNINRLCIDYAFRPRLSSRLTLGGLAFPRNPWTFGGGASHSSFATHANILTRPRSTTGYPAASLQDRRSATARLTRRRTRGFGTRLEPRYIVRAGSLDQ